MEENVANEIGVVDNFVEMKMRFLKTLEDRVFYNNDLYPLACWYDGDI